MMKEPLRASSLFSTILGKSRCDGGSYFLYILLNEIQTMFSQLAKRSARVLPADLCTDHAHYVKNFLLLKIFTVGKILVGTSYMIIIIYLNIFIISYYTTLGDRFASCENIVSRSQTSSLQPPPPPTLVCIMYPFFVSKITCIGPIISSEAIAIEKCSSCNCAYM